MHSVSVLLITIYILQLSSEVDAQPPQIHNADLEFASDETEADNLSNKINVSEEDNMKQVLTDNSKYEDKLEQVSTNGRTGLSSQFKTLLTDLKVS